MTGTTTGTRGRYGPGSLYLAHIRTGRAEVFRNDSTCVDGFEIPYGSNLRRVLVEHGWRPAGHGVSGGAWGAIMVEPLTRN
ncbi:MAG TPA: hypothetical protein VEX15_12805 [Nocardioidaceae bacterium]|nr:hypothetical protein [Nocardioidaceae bacterium]